jgi:hypothetical protein
MSSAEGKTRRERIRNYISSQGVEFQNFLIEAEEKRL